MARPIRIRSPTVNVHNEAPYTFARRFSTLDHLTRGRIGWNIVTGCLESAHRGKGEKQLPEHDRRYDYVMPKPRFSVTAAMAETRASGSFTGSCTASPVMPTPLPRAKVSGRACHAGRRRGC